MYTYLRIGGSRCSNGCHTSTTLQTYNVCTQKCMCSHIVYTYIGLSHILYIHIQTHPCMHAHTCTSVSSRCSNGCYTIITMQNYICMYTHFAYTYTDPCMNAYTYLHICRLKMQQRVPHQQNYTDVEHIRIYIYRNASIHIQTYACIYIHVP